MNANNSGLSYNDIPEIVVNALKAAAARENVFEFSILLSAIAVLVYRYVGCEKTSLNIKTKDLSATIEIDLAPVTTAGELFRQSQLKLEETLKGSLGRGMEIELPGDIIRPFIRFINDPVDSDTAVPGKHGEGGGESGYRFACFNKRHNDETNGQTASHLINTRRYYGEMDRQIASHFIGILSDIIKNPDLKVKDISTAGQEEGDWVVWCD